MRTTDLYTALVALVVGVAVGMLTAPAKGKDTRKHIMKAVTGAKDTLHYALLRGSDLVDPTPNNVPESVEA